MLKLLRRIPIIFFCAVTQSCKTSDDIGRNEIYSSTESFYGEKVKIVGFMIYKPEDQNLYVSKPAQGIKEKYLDKLCVPVLIGDFDQSLARKAMVMSGSYVVVYGNIQRVVDDEDLNISYCKKIGIHATKIDSILR